MRNCANAELQRLALRIAFRRTIFFFGHDNFFFDNAFSSARIGSQMRNLVRASIVVSGGPHSRDGSHIKGNRKGNRAMTTLSKTLLGAAAGAGLLALSPLSAQAAIVCEGNVCWHTHSVYEYPHESGVIIHSDDWRWGPGERFSWREHEGRGYWRGERWIEW
jgi:hypothetical protein